MTESIEDKYQFLINNIVDIVIEIDLNGYIKYISPQVNEIFGYNENEVIGSRSFDFIHSEDLASFANSINAIKETKEILPIELRVRHKDGHYLYITTRAKYINLNGNERILGVLRDVTEDKAIQQKLKESKEILNKITDQTFLGFGIFQDFEIKYYNKEFLKTIGYSSEEVKSWKPGEFFKLILAEDRNRFIKLSRQLYSGNNDALNLIQFRIMKKNGDLLWLEIQTKPVVYKNKKADIVFIQDITTKKEAEIKLKESEEKYRLITEQANDLIDVLNEKFQYEYINENVHKKILGFSNEDMIGKSAIKFIHPEDIERIIKKLKEGFDKGVAQAECRIKKKDGSYIWYESKGNIYYDSSGNKRALIISRDISERKFAEERIRKSEALLSDAQRIAHLGHWEWNVKENELYWSDELYRIYKRPKDFKPTLKEWFTHIHQDDFELHFKTLRENISDNTVFKKQMRIICTDGEIRYIHAEWEVIRDIKKKPVRIFGIVQDITENKRSEQLLREADKRLNFIMNNTNDLIAILDHNFAHEYVNEQAYLSLLGYTTKELIGKKPIKFIHPEDLKRVARAIKNGLIGGGSADEIRIRHKNGAYLWVEIKGKFFTDKEDKFKAIFVSRDITERKKTEQKLMESEQKYRGLFNSIKDGIGLTDLIGNIVDCNQAFLFMTGYTQEEILKFTFEQITPEKWHKKEREILQKQVLAYGYSEEYEKEYIRKDGSIFPISLRTWLIKDGEGNPAGYWAIIRDITEKKESEIKLKESEEKYRHLFENSPFSIILFDSKGKIRDCNNYTASLFSIPLEKILKKDIISLFEENLVEFQSLKENFSNLILGKKFQPMDIKISTNTASLLWINLKFSNIKIGNEDFFYSIIQDITEKKIIENIMFQLNQNFFNFSTDVKKNIQNLIQTAKNLSNGTIVIYARKYRDGESEKVLLVSSENYLEKYSTDLLRKKLFINTVFELEHERPQFYTDLDQNNYSFNDPFIQKYNIKKAYCKKISNQETHASILAILYCNNINISYEIQLALLLISDAIAIEERRWQILEKLEEQNKKLSDLDKLKSEFLRRISHELKTPLVSIKGYSDLILHKNLDEIDMDLTSMVKEIKNGCKRLENLIIQLLDSSKLELDQIKLKFSREDLAFLIKFTVNELQGLAQVRNQKIILEIKDELFTIFEKERIHEVIGNLLTNAIKYTPPYGTIVIKSEIKGIEYIISIRDNGIGFTEKEKQKLFQQFGKIERYGNGSYVETEGSGLGLYICKKLMDLHNGKIWMESEGRNKGSTFYISLPIIQ